MADHIEVCQEYRTALYTRDRIEVAQEYRTVHYTRDRIEIAQEYRTIWYVAGEPIPPVPDDGAQLMTCM